MADNTMGWVVGGVAVLGLGWLVLQLTKGGNFMIPGFGNLTEVMSPGDLTPAQDSALDNNDMFGPETPLTADDGYDDNGKSCRCSDGNIWAFMGTNYMSTGMKAANCDCGQPGRGIVPTGTTTSVTQGRWNAANVAYAYAARPKATKQKRCPTGCAPIGSKIHGGKHGRRF